MSWKLICHDTLPLVTSSTRVSYNQNSAGFRKGFKWTRKAHGDCLQLVFHANPSVVDIKVREVVHLEVDGAPHFTGIVVKHPGHQSKGAGPSDPDSMDEFIVYGLSYFLKETLMNTESVGEAGTLPAKITDLVRYIAQNLITDRTNFGTTLIPARSETISQFYMPYYPMDQALDLLAQSIPGINYGVEALGYFYFKTNTFEHTLDYESDQLYIEWIPINAEEIVTAVTLIVATEPSKAVTELPSSRGVEVRTVSGGVQRYIPRPEIIKHVSLPYNTDYRSNIVRLMGQLLRADGDIIQPAAIFSSLFSNLSNAYDGDFTTYASTSDTTGTATLGYMYKTNEGDIALGKHIVGCRIAYTNVHPTGDVFLSMTYADDPDYSWDLQQRLLSVKLPSTPSISGDPRIIDIILPRTTAFVNDPQHVDMQVQVIGSPNTVRIYEFIPIYKDIILGNEIAKGFIRLPAQNPSVVTVRNQLLSPRSKLYTTNVPGITSGILQGDIAEYEYTLSPEDGKMTQIKFEQPDLSDETLIAKHMSQDLDAQVIGQLRSVGDS